MAQEGRHPVVEMVAELEWVQASALTQLCELRRAQLSLRLQQLSTQRVLLTTEACARTLRPPLVRRLNSYPLLSALMPPSACACVCVCVCVCVSVCAGM